MNPRVQLVLDEFARHRTQFEVLCHSLSEDELGAVVPASHWTVKDYIAHLCTIDGQSAPFPDIPFPNPFDIDEWNDAAVQSRRGRSIDQLLEESRTHRDNIARAIAEFSDAQLDNVIDYGGDRKTLNLPKSKVRFGGLLWGIAIHEPTHTRDILRALPRRAEE